MKTRTTLINNIVCPVKNKLQLCACGCGREVTNKKNRFLYGHNNKNKKFSKETKLRMSVASKGKQISKETKLRMSIARKNKKFSKETRLKISIASKGKKLSKETKLKLSLISTGKKRSQETRLKMSLANFGKKRSEETKFKMSIAAIKYIETIRLNGELLFPNIGKNELYILNEYQTKSGETILRNDHDIAMRIGKFPDGYIQKYNLCIDVLEPHHFKSNGELSDNDQKRELSITSKLGCMIYYIPEQEFLSNSEKEIQRFKDFLLLLEQKRN
jgi:hypothetical protein